MRDLGKRSDKARRKKHGKKYKEYMKNLALKRWKKL